MAKLVILWQTCKERRYQTWRPRKSLHWPVPWRRPRLNMGGKTQNPLHLGMPHAMPAWSSYDSATVHVDNANCVGTWAEEKVLTENYVLRHRKMRVWNRMYQQTLALWAMLLLDQHWIWRWQWLWRANKRETDARMVFISVNVPQTSLSSSGR